MIIQHNMMAMNAQRQFGLIDVRRSKNMEKLSSGFKINRAADDAAGLAISEKMRRQIRGLTRASMNCQDGISLVQIADGALHEVHDMLHRCTELSVQAANGPMTDVDRNYLQEEVAQILEEIDRISERTTYNEIPVLKGAEAEAMEAAELIEPTIEGSLPSYVISASSSLQANHLTGTYEKDGMTYAGGTIDFSMVNATNISDFDDTGFCMTCATCNRHYSVRFTDEENPSPVKENSGAHFIYNVSTYGVTSGEELVDRIHATLDNGHPNGHYTQMDKEGAILHIYDNRGVNTALGDLSRLESYKTNSKLQPGIAVGQPIVIAEDAQYDIQIQAGSEEGNTIPIKLPSISTQLLEIGGANVGSQASASMCIAAFKNAIEYVSGERSRMGAYQNRLEHTINNLDNVIENTTAAESMIRDTDMAQEMTMYTNNNILAQAGQAVLAQANQSQQGTLTLLG
ncbi:MAG: flagellar hook protein [Lachnospiraceae bacterium]|nr:flagellar hook protein [Lachnospiraceae bacterium]